MGGLALSLEKILFVPDTHRPYHDKRAWATMLKAARALKPARVVVLGDFLDCASISAHSKDPARLQRFASEVLDANHGLSDLDDLKAKHYHFVEGNHEFRLPRYLQDKAPELTEMLNIPELLNLRARGWSYTPYRDHLEIGQLYVTHETGVAGATAHMRSLSDFQDNVVIGHTHRMGITYSGNAKGRPHVGAMFGWLGDKSVVDYMHKVKANRDWMLGFGVGYLERRTGVVHVQAIPLISYTAVIEGSLIRG